MSVQWKRYLIAYGTVIVIEVYCDVCKFSQQWTGRNAATFPGYKHCGKQEPVPGHISGAVTPVEKAEAAAPQPSISWM